MAINLDKTLKTLLETNITGLKVWALEKPKEAALPTVVYKRVSRRNYMSHSGIADLKRDWIQITHIASTYDSLRTLVANVESQLIGNSTSWNISIPNDNLVEFKQDGLYFANRDYLIFYK